jgi:hypothetical protein
MASTKDKWCKMIDALALPGRAIFSFAIVALGVETIVCMRVAQEPLGPGYSAVPVLPWLPAIPWLVAVFGVIWVACGVGLLTRRWLRISAIVLGGLLALCALVLVLPKYIAAPGNMGLRTVVLEPLALGAFALLLPGEGAMPAWVVHASRWVIALAFIVFGVDHFLALEGIGSLLPDWIPWHVFWIAFFGVVFVAGGLSIGLRLFDRWATAGIGLMFGIWVITLHLPRTLGFYSVLGALHDPDEWSSLFIAIGLWGASWALIGNRVKDRLIDQLEK